MADYKFKKGDIILNGHGGVLGTIVKADKTDDDKNKYGILTPDGEVTRLENQIQETNYKKDKDKI